MNAPTAVCEVRCAACGWSEPIDDETPGTTIALKVGAHLECCPRRAFGHPAFGMTPRWTTELAHYPDGTKVRIMVTWGPATMWAPFHLDVLREKWAAPPPLEVELRPGDPPHPAADDSLAVAIEGSRQTVLEVIEEAPDVNAVNSVSIRLAGIEAIFEWYVATLRAAAEAKRLELGGAPKPQG